MSLKRKLARYFRMDRELLIVFSLVAITGIIFFFVSNQRAFLNFFYFPVLIGAYFFGKRYATQSGVLSIILVTIVAYYYPATFTTHMGDSFERWLDIATWGAFLLLGAYFMGHLYEKKEKANEEIKKTYQGIIEIMSLVIDSADSATQSHAYRVSVISGMIAREMGLSETWVENIRVASLLHDLGKFGVSREVLNKFSKSTCPEYAHMRLHTKHGPDTLDPVCGKILDILPSMLYYGEKYDGSGDSRMVGDDIPLGARIIAVADAYDSLLSEPSRKGMSASDAKQQMVKRTITDFDPGVVKAFTSVCPRLEGELPLLTAKARL